jgi:ubiquinone/menaquinone biosynthesis C-methylase UbiE
MYSQQVLLATVSSNNVDDGSVKKCDPWKLKRRNPMNLADVMRRDWNERAKQNAFHYIASWQKDWNVEAFLQSGEEDFQKLVVPVLRRNKMPETGRTMLELGCGAGRMTGSFASRFERVLAVDISEQMLARAKQIHADSSHIDWKLSNGTDLSGIPDGAVDFAFSYIVLQHLPQEALAFHYIQEILRVLKPGGSFLFQFNGETRPTMNWRGRLIWGLIDGLWSLQLVKLGKGIAAFYGLDPATVGRSWRGTALSEASVAEAVFGAGGQIREMIGEKSPMAWCCGFKRLCNG